MGELLKSYHLLSSLMSSEPNDSNERKPERQPESTDPAAGQATGSRDQGRHAVVGILYEDRHFLVIRRSQLVRAPGLICFPGGGIEPGEDFETAVKRELREELGLAVEVQSHFWSSQTRWGTKLEWLVCQRDPSHEPIPNLEEVEEYLWMSVEMLEGRGDLLGSMPDFLAGIRSGRFSQHFVDA